MESLPAALSALADYRQFIVCRHVPHPTRPGRMEKIPVDWRSGQTADAHDPSIWLDAATAIETARAWGPSYAVGFAFTAADPFFFIDIDDCAAPGGWSPVALDLCLRFAGAAVEISQSGTGLHIIGTGDAGPTEARRKKASGWDLYTEARFVSLTGAGIIGDAATRHDAALAALVSAYLQRDASDASGWTDGPCEGWNGPADDDRLIERAMRSGSAASAFGNKAPFAALWTGDTATLARCYPDDHGDRPYDASAADAALAQHLAFWTGKDCVRIERLMRRSALARAKWDERDDYLRDRTIMGAVRRQRDILTDKPVEPPRTAPAATGGSPRGVAVTGETFLSADEQVNLFEGCVYVLSEHKALVPGGYLLKPDQFKVMFGGYSFPMDAQNERVVRNAWECFTESQMLRFPRADRLAFRPEHEPGAIIVEGNMTYANLWWPIDTIAVEGDVSPFLNHVAKLLPDEGDRMKLLAYMAACRQYPGRKFHWAPVIQGVEGNGKSFLIKAMTRSIGERYSHIPNAHDLSGNGLKFNGWMIGKLFIGIEEIYTADRREILEALKNPLTADRLDVQKKGEDQSMIDNFANFMATTNHRDGVPISDTSRRWGIFFTAQQNFEDLSRDGMDGEYMPDLWDWFEGRRGHTPGWQIINHFLSTWAIPDELNPATKMHRAPETTSTAEALRMSLGAVEQEIVESIEQGVQGFAGGWVSSMALDKLLVRLRAERRIPPSKRRDMMQSLGYDWHPHLIKGRTNNVVSPDGGRPKLFIKSGHLAANITDPAAVAAAYTKAQMECIFPLDAAVNGR
jgi:hypothetical protein